MVKPTPHRIETPKSSSQEAPWSARKPQADRRRRGGEHAQGLADEKRQRHPDRDGRQGAAKVDRCERKARRGEGEERQHQPGHLGVQRFDHAAQHAFLARPPRLDGHGHGGGEARHARCSPPS